jgi:hypothetical protein
MTWSFRIVNGDLVKGPGNSIDIVTGPDKVVQDLMCHIKEPYGTDPLNPDLGSFIYTEEEGTVIYANGITNFLSDDYSEMVVSEIKRIIEAYQEKQMARLRAELQEYNGLYTFSDNEIIENFNIYYQNDYDTLYITIDLEMVSGDYFSIDVPIENPNNYQNTLEESGL